MYALFQHKINEKKIELDGEIIENVIFYIKTANFYLNIYLYKAKQRQDSFQ